MAQKYKVYYNNRVIYIGRNIPGPEVTAAYRVCHYHAGVLKQEWENFRRDPEAKDFYIIGNPEPAWKEFRKLFLMIKAAGGIVKNLKGEYLLIYRNKVWDLPKGKMDEGEKPRETALREVEEECGIKKLQVGNLYKKSYHIYEFKSKLALKKTYWFKMTCGDDRAPVPEKEEGIEKAIWVTPSEFRQWKKEMYPSVWSILKKIE